jgi:hypothetical protein
MKYIKRIENLNTSHFIDGEIVFCTKDQQFYLFENKFLTKIEDSTITKSILEISESDGEVLCDKCNGLSYFNGIYCEKCFGDGKLLWTEHLKGGKDRGSIDCFNYHGTSYGTSYGNFSSFVHSNSFVTDPFSCTKELPIISNVNFEIKNVNFEIKQVES